MKKAKPLKSGDAKLKGLRETSYVSQLPVCIFSLLIHGQEKIRKGESSMKKFAKTLIVMGMAGAASMLPTVVHAAETDGVAETSVADQRQADPGMTPESTFYFLDKFGEKFHLLVTQNAEKKSNLYLQYAEERMAESAQLSDSAKEKYLTALVENYVKNIQMRRKQSVKLSLMIA